MTDQTNHQKQATTNEELNQTTETQADDIQIQDQPVSKKNTPKQKKKKTQDIQAIQDTTVITPPEIQEVEVSNPNLVTISDYENKKAHNDKRLLL